MSRRAMITLLKAIYESLPIELRPDSVTVPCMVVDPVIWGREECVFVADDLACGGGGGGVEVVAELGGEAHLWFWGGGEVHEDESLGCGVDVDWEERVLFGMEVGQDGGRGVGSCFVQFA